MFLNLAKYVEAKKKKKPTPKKKQTFTEKEFSIHVFVTH